MRELTVSIMSFADGKQKVIELTIIVKKSEAEFLSEYYKDGVQSSVKMFLSNRNVSIKEALNEKFSK